MAKIILKANIPSSKRFSAPWESVEVPLYSTADVDPVEVILTPYAGGVIDAADFSHGLLPSNITSIEFNNSKNIVDVGNRVVAKVSIAKFKVISEIISLELPISGISRVSSNEFTLIDNTSVDSNIIVSGGGTSVVKGDVGEVVNVLNKTFKVPDGYKFIKEPNYNINGNSKSYKVSVKIDKDNKGNTVCKSFTVLYTFPQSNLTDTRTDTISFSATSSAIAKQEIKVATKKEEYKIYSIDTGAKVGLAGGFKKLTVSGVPGSRFKVLTQNSSGDVYNYETGLFSGGRTVEGIIPPAKKGVGFGVFKKYIKVPKSTTDNNITTRVIEDKDIDHVALRKAIEDPYVSTTPDQTTVITDPIEALSTATLTLKDGGATGTGHAQIFKIYRPLLHQEDATTVTINSAEYVANGTYALGGGTYNSPIGTWVEANPIKISGGGRIATFNWLITADGNGEHFIRINRQPRFAQAKTYRRWDSAYASEDTKENTSAGLSILTDWGTSIRHAAGSDTSDGTTLDFKDWVIDEMEMSIDGDGLGPPQEDFVDPQGHLYVKISLAVTGTFGKEDIVPELNLKNFLTVYQ